MGDIKAVSDAYTAAFNAHDEEQLRSLWGDGTIFTAPGDVRLQGSDPIAEYAMGWLHAFPDARITIENELISGNWVVQQFRFEGTHTETLVGPGGEIPATGRKVSGRGAEIIRIDDDTIVEDHLYFDQVQLLTQLGLMPEPAAAHA